MVVEDREVVRWRRWTNLDVWLPVAQVEEDQSRHWGFWFTSRLGQVIFFHYGKGSTSFFVSNFLTMLTYCVWRASLPVLLRQVDCLFTLIGWGQNLVAQFMLLLEPRLYKPCLISFRQGSFWPLQGLNLLSAFAVAALAITWWASNRVVFSSTDMHMLFIASVSQEAADTGAEYGSVCFSCEPHCFAHFLLTGFAFEECKNPKSESERVNTNWLLQKAKSQLYHCQLAHLVNPHIQTPSVQNSSESFLILLSLTHFVQPKGKFFRTVWAVKTGNFGLASHCSSQS